MSRFILIPSFTVGDPGQWILAGDLVYESDYLGRLVEVPAGFETDLASIPKIVPRWLIDLNEKHRLPAVVHDYLCRTALTRKQRARGDHVFLEAMALQGMPRWKRWAMFSAVRLMTMFKRFPK